MKKITLMFCFVLLLIPFVSKAEVIFEDNFDGYNDWSSDVEYGTLEDWPGTAEKIFGGPVKSPFSNFKGWLDYRSGRASNTFGLPLYQINSVGARSGKSLNYNYELDSYMNGGGVDLLFGPPDGGYEEIYLRFYLKLPNQAFNEQRGGDFWKILRINTGVNPDNKAESPHSTFLCSTCSPQVKRSQDAIVNIQRDGNNDWHLAFTYLSGMLAGIDYIPNTHVFPLSTLNFRNYTEKWIQFQLYAKLNTIGQTDGQMKAWIAEEGQVIDFNKPTAIWDNLEIRTDPLRKWNLIVLADNISNGNSTITGQVERTINIDDLVIADSFISSDYVIGGITPVPLLVKYNLSHFTNLFSNWLKAISGQVSDVNNDGVVNAKDLGIMMNKWE